MQTGYLIPPSVLDQWAALLDPQPQEIRNAGLVVGLIVVGSVVCLIVVCLRFRACMLSHAWRPSDKVAICSAVRTGPPTISHGAYLLSSLHFCTTRCSALVGDHYLKLLASYPKSCSGMTKLKLNYHTYDLTRQELTTALKVVLQLWQLLRHFKLTCL